MKPFIQSSILSSLLFSSAALALNPNQGFYLGLLGDISIGPASYTLVFGRENPEFRFDSDRLLTDRIQGRVNNTRLGGGGAASLGYRYNQFRIEGEVLYNYNGSNSITVGDCTVVSPVLDYTGGIIGVTSVVPTAICQEVAPFRGRKIGFNGTVTSIYGMGNVFYDFINYDNDSYAFPYIGLGVGYVQVTNRGNFIENFYLVESTRSAGMKSTYSSFAGQAIIGAGLFLDDLTWASMDYRYTTSGTIKNYGDNRYTTVPAINNIVSINADSSRRYIIQSINFGINMSFDKGSNA